MGHAEEAGAVRQSRARRAQQLAVVGGRLARDAVHVRGPREHPRRCRDRPCDVPTKLAGGLCRSRPGTRLSRRHGVGKRQHRSDRLDGFLGHSGGTNVDSRHRRSRLHRCHTVAALRAQGRDVVVLDSLETGYQRGRRSARRLVVGDIADGDARPPRRRRARRRQHHPLRRLQERRRVGAGPRQVLRATTWSARRACSERSKARRCDRSSSPARARSTARPSTLPVGETAPLQPESPYGQSKLMVEQMLGWYGEPRPALHEPALLQRSGASRDAVIGEDLSVTLNLVPLVMKAALGLRPPLRCSAPTSPRPTAPPSATTSTSTTWPTPTSAPSSTSERGGASVAVNLGTGTGSSVRQVIDAAERGSGLDSPREYVGRRPATRRRLRRQPPSPPSCSAGSHVRARRDRRVGVALAFHPPPRLRRLSPDAPVGPDSSDPTELRIR